MTRRHRNNLAVFLLLCLLVFPAAAHAACNNPSGNEAAIVFNNSEKQLQYCDGTDWIAMHPVPNASSSDPCDPADSPSPGQACSDGSVYAGLSPDGDVPMYTTPADEGLYPWSNGNSSNYTATLQTSDITGASNTTNIIMIDSDSGTGGMQPHQAAQSCADLSSHDHSDWYLPSLEELNLLYTNRAAVGDFDTSGSAPTGYYWSSTETGTTLARYQRFSTGGQGNQTKYYAMSVRCVRKGYVAATGCANPSRPEGTLIYNLSHRVMQGCAGGEWKAMGPVSPATPLHFPADGLISYWRLDETTGTMADDSAGSNDGTMQGGLDGSTDSISGKVATALDMDGTDDYIDTGYDPSFSNTDDFSITFWFKPDKTSNGTDEALFSTQSVEVEELVEIEIDRDGSVCSTNDIAVQIDDEFGGTDELVCGSYANSTTWQHAAAVYDHDGKLSLYINGILTGSTPVTESTGGIDLTGRPFYIGANNVGASSVFFDGAIDDVRAYSRALNETEIEALYHLRGICENPQRLGSSIVYNSSGKLMQYCDGANWVAIGKEGNTPADPCAGSPSPGDTCADGSYYIGQIGGEDIYATAAASESTETWNNGTSNWTTTGFTSPTDGPGNTAGLVATGDAGSPYDAAEYCDGLTNVHGHSDWYLPAKDELNLFYNGGSPVADVLEGTGNWYWSSSENLINTAWIQRFSDGLQNTSNKTLYRNVRCARR